MAHAVDRAPGAGEEVRRDGSASLHVAVLGVASVIVAALLLWLGRGRTFHFDEWDWVLGRSFGGVHTLLERHNDHISVLPVAAYRVLFEVFGFGSTLPFRVLVVVLHLGCVWAVFALARRRVGADWALLAALLVLVLGRAWEDLLWGFQIGFVGSVLGGLLAWLALDRAGDARAAGAVGRPALWWSVAACVCLVGSVLSSSLGVPIALGVGVELALGRRRDLWIVAVPLLLYVAWYLGYGDSTMTSEGVWHASPWALDAFGAAAGALLGRGLDWGQPLAVLLVLAVGVGVARAARSASVGDAEAGAGVARSASVGETEAGVGVARSASVGEAEAGVGVARSASVGETEAGVEVARAASAGEAEAGVGVGRAASVGEAEAAVGVARADSVGEAGAGVGVARAASVGGTDAGVGVGRAARWASVGGTDAGVAGPGGAPWRGGVTPRLAGLLAAAIAFWLLTGAARSVGATANAPETSRYVYLGAVVLVLVVCEVAGPWLARRPPVPRRIALAVTAVVVLVSASQALTVVHDAAASLRATSDAVKAELAAATLAARHLPPGYQPAPAEAPQITWQRYADAVRFQRSSPIDAPRAVLAAAGAADRAKADRVLTETEVTVVPAAPGAPGACRTTRDATLVMRGPQVTIRSGDAPVTLRVRRFAPSFGEAPPLDVVAAHQSRAVRLARDGGRTPWVLAVASSAPARVCAASG